MRLRVLIADDEAMARKRAARLLGALEGVEIVGTCSNGEEVLALLERGDEEIDVVLLDIHLTGLSGLDVKARLPADGPRIVFATAHPEHALAAFDVGAADFVTKPLELGRLRMALDRVRQSLGRPEKRVPTRLAVETRGGIVLIATSAISHVTWDGTLSTVHAGSDTYLTTASLTELEAKLGEGAFERVQRRALVNLDLVQRLAKAPNGGYEATLRGGAIIDVSRQAARRLRRMLGLHD